MLVNTCGFLKFTTTTKNCTFSHQMVKMKYGKLILIIRPSILLSTRNFNAFIPQDPTFLSGQEHYYTSIASTLQHYINSDNPSHGQKIHSHILKIGFIPNTNISIKLLILYLKSSCLSYARKVFDELRQPTLSAYNYMISGYAKQGEVEELFSMVRRLGLCNEKPDGFTFSMILKASTCDRVLTLKQSLGKQVHAQIVKYDLKTDDILYTALVDSYIKSGMIDYARRVFDLNSEKNVVCSTSLISGYMAHGSVQDAKDIFDKTVDKDVVIFNAMIEGYSKSIETAETAIEFYIDMQRQDFRPTLSTYASIIGACSVLSAYTIGQQIQGQITKTTFFRDIKVGSALVDMYSKCGRVWDARNIFDEMPEKNVFSWTSMIDGYGKNGNPDEALELFSIMQREFSVKPNYVTFLGALSACAHAGLVDKGKQIFTSMESNYDMKPKMEHYACMVDLLGRAGSLDEALQFIAKMSDKPNSDVWAALLSSSRLHGDVETAKIAASKIFKLSGEDRPGAYVALSNTLAEAGKWDNVSELRELMKVRMISKDTGFSWVGSEGGLECFHAGQKV